MKKTKQNPHFKSNFASLDEMLPLVKSELSKNNLFLSQPCSDQNVITSIIYDCETGEPVISSSMNLSELSNMQKAGSSITYARRYTLKALLAISDEDDDGNAASAPTQNTKVKKPAKSVDIKGIVASLPKDLSLYKVKFLTDFKGKDLGQLTDLQLLKLKDSITDKIAGVSSGEVFGVFAEDVIASKRYLTEKRLM